MGLIKVKAKIGGVHALTGISLVAGEEYTIDERYCGAEVFEQMTDDAEKKGTNVRKRMPADDVSGSPAGEEKEG